MRPYEVVVIFDAGLEEEQIRSVLDRSTASVTDGGGVVNRVDRWGKRRLAYEIKRKTEGYYVLVEATAPPAAMIELDRQLRLTDGILRHKVIRIPDKVAGRERRTLVPAVVDADAPAVAEAGD